jgi:calcineurin-like phosphoesterase family protein
MKFSLSIVLFFLITSCSTTTKIEYSFFVAGHTYGDPREKNNNIGLYKPFKEKILFINNQKKLKQGFLLGDVVWMPKNWPEAIEDTSKFNMPIKVVRGNHDGKLEKFEEYFGKSYKKFFIGKDLFIVLDPNLDHWNISGDQLVFLRNTLRIDGKKANNIFIFTHQLIWYNEENFSKPKPNSTYGKDEKTNFWPVIEPLLKSQEKPVFIFSGDVGAFSKEYRRRDHIIEYYYHNYDNITFIASGMGGGTRDNFVIIDVLNDASVKFRFIHINAEDINSLGKLEDYINPN